MKKFVSLLLIFSMLVLPVLANGGNGESGVTHHIPRVVSILFDDSTSMYEEKAERWAYASYAMQSLCAMLDEEDTLYVTYLNAYKDKPQQLYVTVDLKKSTRQAEINNFANIKYGGGTKLDNIGGKSDLLNDVVAQVLRDKYNANIKNGIDAKYFLLILTDGELENKPAGEFERRTDAAGALLKQQLSEADFTYRFFDMSKVSEQKIVERMQEISTEIMGKEEVASSVSNGKLSFTLNYPALSVAVYIQKVNGDFNKLSGISANRISGEKLNPVSYSIKCPVNANKREGFTSKIEGVPANPPAGAISVITPNKGKSALAKGEYSVDLSTLNIDGSETVVVLAEPAVVAGCRYYIDGSETEVPFDEVVKNIRAGQKLKIVCNLYEINEDGSVGAEVSKDIFKNCDYKLSINGQEYTPAGEKNTFIIDIKEEHSNGELRVEAKIGGYNPFYYRGKFGEIRISGSLKNKGGSETVKITKPVYGTLASSGLKIGFEFDNIKQNILSDYSLRSSYSGFPSGRLDKITGTVLNGKTVEFILRVPDGETFNGFPENAKVELVDDRTGEVIYTYKFEKQAPTYKIETVNNFASGVISIGRLRSNTDGITFRLVADYDGSGNYSQIKPEYEDETPEIAVETGGLPGNVEAKGLEATFTPRKDSNLQELSGKSFKISASAQIDGKTVKSEVIPIDLIGVSYRIVAENGLTEGFTINKMKDNTGKIVFRLEVDYEGGDNYGAIGDWDDYKYELTVNQDSLPGDVKKEESGNTVCFSFTPHKDGDLSELAGKTFNIYASTNIKGMNVRSEVITVKFPEISYRIRVENEIGEEFTLEELKDNAKRITFRLEADYEGGENYGSLADWDIDKYGELKINQDSLPGTVNDEKDGKSFTPHRDGDLSELAGKTFSISASINIKEREVKSDAVTVAFSVISYRIIVENNIAEELTLDDLKKNTKKIVFKLEADYSGDGNYGAIADWDTGKYADLLIKTDVVPGDITEEKDSSGKIIGMAFTPVYDELINKDIIYTKVTAHTHKVTAELKNSGKTAEAEFTVAAPVFTIQVAKENISVMDTALPTNTLSVDFVIRRDGRILTREELEGLAPFNIEYDKRDRFSWVTTYTEIALNGNNEAYLRCIPTHEGHIIWNWFSVCAVRHGERTMTLTIGQNIVDAKLKLTLNTLVLVITLICAFVLLFIVYMLFCIFSRKKFAKGNLVVYTIEEWFGDYKLSRVLTKKLKSRVAFRNLVRPRRTSRSTSVDVGENKIPIVMIDNGVTFGKERIAPKAIIDLNRLNVIKPVWCNCIGDSAEDGELLYSIDESGIEGLTEDGKYEQGLSDNSGVLSITENGGEKYLLLFEVQYLSLPGDDLTV